MFARSLDEYVGQFRGDDSLYVGRRVLVNAPGIYGNGKTGVITATVGSNGWAVDFGKDSEGIEDWWSYYDEQLIPL